MEAQGAVERKKPSKRARVVVVVVVCVLVSSVVAFAWYQYFRHWTIEDIAESVTGTVENPTFKTSLADRTVTVEGTVTDIESHGTDLGTVHFVELDDCLAPRLVYWGDIDLQVGDEVESDVSFEWSTYNNNTMVLSPQLDFPNLFSTLGIEMVHYISYREVSDICWSSSVGSDIVTVEFDWVRNELPLSDINCSLRIGRAFWAYELMDSGLPQQYGEELVSASTLSSSVGSAGAVRYVDADFDGRFSKGDSVVLSGLETPRTDSGIQCYMLVLGLGPTLEANDGYFGMYLPLMKAGLLHVVDSPHLNTYADFQVQDDGDGYTLTTLFSMGGANWSGVSYILTSDSNCSDYISALDVRIDAFVEESATGSETTWFSGQVTSGDLVWEISVTDVDGDGVISVGDRISLTSDSDDVDSALEYLRLELVYDPTDGSVQEFDLIEE